MSWYLDLAQCDRTRPPYNQVLRIVITGLSSGLSGALYQARRHAWEAQEALVVLCAVCRLLRGLRLSSLVAQMWRLPEKLNHAGNN